MGLAQEEEGVRLPVVAREEVSIPHDNRHLIRIWPLPPGAQKLRIGGRASHRGVCLLPGGECGLQQPKLC